QGDGAEQFSGFAVEGFGHCQRGRHDRRAGVEAAGRVAIVEVEGVGGGAVGGGRTGRAEANVRAEDGGRAVVVGAGEVATDDGSRVGVDAEEGGGGVVEDDPPHLLLGLPGNVG